MRDTCVFPTRRYVMAVKIPQKYYCDSVPLAEEPSKNFTYYIYIPQHKWQNDQADEIDIYYNTELLVTGNTPELVAGDAAASASFRKRTANVR